MHKSSLPEVLNRIKDTDVVLDIGGWANPFERANYVLDALSYDTRGKDGQIGVPERFTKDTWIQWDICNRQPWPFKDKQFDFAICSHVLEDIRDPLWVCSEMIRVAKSGYIETPTREAELLYGVQSYEFTGFQHHRWFVENVNGQLFFTQKTPLSHTEQNGFYLIHTDSIMRFFWTDKFHFEEKFAGVDPFSTGDKMMDWKSTFQKNMPTKIKVVNEVCRWLPGNYLKKNVQKTFRSLWKLPRI
ncbi:MAG: methyltransferase domain-containing protein [Bdellovibrionaceae bacterium]|nr:methyltransferase domain-containing protein [Pseudobdellovibrionaceae bacterium]